jgi:cell division transport system permease protein
LIPREQAWADLQRRAGDGQPFADIKPNPLPDTLVAEFARQASPAVVSAAVATIRKQPRVESVQADLEWDARLVAILQVAASMLIPIVGIVALLVIVVALWLVRLLAVVERDELRLLEQIGAEEDFIRRPFIYAGAVVLGLAASAALGLVAIGRLLANQGLAEPGRLLGLEVVLNYSPWPLVVAFVAGCVLLGAVAGNYCASRQIAAAKSSP